MNRFYKELQEIINKYSESIDNYYKYSSEDLIIQKDKFEKAKEGFNKEFKRFLEDEDEYLCEFIGSNLAVLKNHINLKSINLNEEQKINYIKFLQENLKVEYNNNFLKALKNKRLLDASNSFYYLKALNQKNESLIEFNARKKNNYLKELLALGIVNTQPPISKTEKTENPVNLRHWNEACFNLFQYLVENYYTDQKRQLTNIWYFLKNNLFDNQYYFKMTKSHYIEFIEINLNIKLTNFEKSVFKFDGEMMVLQELKKHFEKQ